MNEWASPQTTFTTPRVERERILFVIEENDGPHQNDWTSEPY